MSPDSKSFQEVLNRIFPDSPCLYRLWDCWLCVFKIWSLICKCRVSRFTRPDLIRKTDRSVDLVKSDTPKNRHFYHPICHQLALRFEVERSRHTNFENLMDRRGKKQKAWILWTFFIFSTSHDDRSLRSVSGSKLGKNNSLYGQKSCSASRIARLDTGDFENPAGKAWVLLGTRSTVGFPCLKHKTNETWRILSCTSILSWLQESEYNAENWWHQNQDVQW